VIAIVLTSVEPATREGQGEHRGTRLDDQVANDWIVGMSLYDIPLTTLSGDPATLPEGKALLLVNVASKCGLTPQYTGLEELQKTYGDRGFSVLGFPCNQFLGQEPGTAEEIAEFCSATYGVTFPLFEKLEVNGPDRHPLFEELTAVADASGHTGDVRWNFEKWLVSPDGKIVGRYSPQLEPDDAALIGDIEAQLP
jgi:glutathione peroxidase